MLKQAMLNKKIDEDAIPAIVREESSSILHPAGLREANGNLMLVEKIQGVDSDTMRSLKG